MRYGKQAALRNVAIMEAFNLKDVAALDVWIADGCPTDEGWPDSGKLKYDDGVYRVKTEEDREAERAADRERRRRYEAGEMDEWDRLSYEVLRAYQKQLTDALFSPRPMVYTLTRAEPSGSVESEKT